MGNAFQDQLLKAGLVTKQQVQKANKTKHQKKKQQSKKQPAVDETRLKLQKKAQEKLEHDRELDKKKEHIAKQKAVSHEINQLIIDNCIKRDSTCEITFNFEHAKKVKHLYVNNDMKQKIIKGQLGIARIEGRYELVPKDIAEKIQLRNKKRIVLFEEETETVDENDPYADFKIPDDLTW